MRKIQSLHNAAARRSATIYRDASTGEFVVKFSEHDRRLTEADYFTDDKLDALGTAAHFVQG